jgi:hypothetical protein
VIKKWKNSISLMVAVEHALDLVFLGVMAILAEGIGVSCGAYPEIPVLALRQILAAERARFVSFEHKFHHRWAN